MSELCGIVDGEWFTHPCRCSGEYRMTQEDLESGFDVVGCSLCSLRIRVLYSVVEEKEEEELTE